MDFRNLMQRIVVMMSIPLVLVGGYLQFDSTIARAAISNVAVDLPWVDLTSGMLWLGILQGLGGVNAGRLTALIVERK